MTSCGPDKGFLRLTMFITFQMCVLVRNAVLFL